MHVGIKKTRFVYKGAWQYLLLRTEIFVEKEIITPLSLTTHPWLKERKGHVHHRMHCHVNMTWIAQIG